MITYRTGLQAASIGVLLAIAAACDGGKPSRSADEIAADSALAADLALANRDTLLVDSIGEYRPPDAGEIAGEADTMIGSVDNPPPPSPTVSSPPAAAPSRNTAPAPPPPKPAATTPDPVSKPAPKPAAATPSAPKVTGLRACSVPGLDNQSECVRVSLASADARLNRIYRALITEMRRQEGVPGGAKDPPSVQRLRVSQRSWLVYRDTECRRRGRGNEGPLWARPRVRCLGQFSGRRANELADNFSRLTAH